MTPRGAASCLALLFCALLAGCHGCRAVDYPVSSPTTDPTGLHRSASQSETSMVRIDQPERPRGEPAARYLAAYNDATNAMLAAGADCWAFNAASPSLDGWSSSEEFGGNWLRQGQLSVSPALQERGVRARHGDPWLAAWNDTQSATAPGAVLYVSVGQAGLARLGGPWFLLLSRSRDRGVSFEDPVVVRGPQGAVPDGPKVAISGDGVMAVVIWNEGAAGIPFRPLSNLTEPTMSLMVAGLIHPETIAAPPQPGCTFGYAAAHPRVAAGASTMYAAARVTYHCGGTDVNRLEVYRNSNAGLAFRVPWQRIVSVETPPSLPTVGFGVLNGQDVAGPTRFGTRVDRGSSLPVLAVGQAKDGEFVVLADLQVEAGTQPDEAHRERVVLFRLGQSNTCDAAHHLADLDSCGTVRLAGRAVDDIATAGDMQTIASRVGVWESKPAVFTGKVPNGTVDERVGVVWYTQPYKGRMSVTDEMRARTIVEAAVSVDAGVTFEGPFNLTADEADERIAADPDIGSFFHPCQLICPTFGYFGEYISGVFQFGDPGPRAIVASWGDSREGCSAQGVHNQHHHVWAGAIRPK